MDPDRNVTDEHIASAEARLLGKQIEDVEKRVSENRRKNEEQHRENKQRLDDLRDALAPIPVQLTLLKKAIDDHAVSDERQLSELNKGMNDLLLVLKLGRAARTLGDFIRGAIVFWTPFAVAVAVTYAMYLWFRGKGPFPFP